MFACYFVFGVVIVYGDLGLPSMLIVLWCCHNAEHWFVLLIFGGVCVLVVCHFGFWWFARFRGCLVFY